MDGKKKKGKKKKGNLNKHSGSISTAEDVNQTKRDSASNAEEVLPDHFSNTTPEQNHHSGALSNTDSQSVGVSESDVEQERRKNLKAKCVELQEEINMLEVEKNIWSQKEGSLEEIIKLLQNEVESCIQKEASLEEKIDDLQSKNALLTMREATFEERVKKMEEMNQSFALEESSIKEVVSKLGDANERLQMQVLELEESRDSLTQENKQLTESRSTLESRLQQLTDSLTQETKQLTDSLTQETKQLTDSLTQENKQLTESISTLASRIQQLEMIVSFYASSKIHGEEKSNPNAAEASVKPDILNEDPSEKVSEIHVEPVQLAWTAENPTSEKTKVSSTVKSATSDYTSEFKENIIESNKKIEYMATTNETYSVDGSIDDLRPMEQLRQIHLLGLDDSRISEDVVSVPLDDNIQELLPTANKIEAGPAIPLSDAPLIGAPFRLISFVARYVSGADLVDQDKTKAGR